MPTRQAVETISACTPEMWPSLSLCLLFSSVTRIISGNSRKGKNRVRTVKYTPAGTKISTSRGQPQGAASRQGDADKVPPQKMIDRFNDRLYGLHKIKPHTFSSKIRPAAPGGGRGTSVS